MTDDLKLSMREVALLVIWAGASKNEWMKWGPPDELLSVLYRCAAAVTHEGTRYRLESDLEVTRR